MTGQHENVVPIASRAGRLADALRRARARQEAQDAADAGRRQGSLAVLAEELSGLAGDLPAGEVDRFDLVRSVTGDRLVIDALSHVELAGEGRAYRLVRQHREGPRTLLETGDREALVQRVADYMAERIVEREGLARPAMAAPAPPAAPAVRLEAPAPAPAGIGAWGGVLLFLLGALCGAVALFSYAWLSYPAAG